MVTPISFPIHAPAGFRERRIILPVIVPATGTLIAIPAVLAALVIDIQFLIRMIVVVI